MEAVQSGQNRFDIHPDPLDEGQFTFCLDEVDPVVGASSIQVENVAQLQEPVAFDVQQAASIKLFMSCSTQVGVGEISHWEVAVFAGGVAGPHR